MSDEAPSWMKPHGRNWQVRSRKTLQENPWFQLSASEATAPTGVDATYYLIHFVNSAVGVIPLHDDGTISLVGQWRFPFNAYSWELPEGGVPADEAPMEGAKRELREEVGLIATNWRQILTLQTSNASVDEVARVFLATGLSAVETEPDDTEDLATVRVPFQEALAQANAGRIQDAMTVAGLLRLHHMAVTGELDGALTRLVLGSSKVEPS